MDVNGEAMTASAAADAASASPNDVLISVRSISKQFGGTQALANVSMHVDRGEIVALRFPGTPECYRALAQVTDSTHLARASEWAATSAPAGEAYNVTNGDIFRWDQMWPVFAEFFDMPLGNLQMIPVAETMKDKAPVWESIVRQHNLAPTPWQGIALWGAADFVLRCGYDVVSSTTKIRQAGFGNIVDSKEMFLRMLGDFRQRRLIP